MRSFVTRHEVLFSPKLIVEHTRAGLAAARARGRLGGRPRKMDRATLTMVIAAMADPKANAASYVNSDGSVKEAGQRLLDKDG